MLQTITPEYQKLNAKMHRKTPGWGAGSWRHVDAVTQFMEDTSSATVLDYGCGKGKLREALGAPEWFTEYDPCVHGKDATPEPADLVVCTDVLEHIEPDLLDNVLKDIARCAIRAAFIVIATRPAKAMLPNGSQPHLIIQDKDWWLNKLKDYFYIIDVTSDTERECTIKAAKVAKLGGVKAKSAVSDDLRLVQAIRNCGVVKESVGDAPRHDGRVAIVAYGPSLKETWQYLATERRAFGTKIVSVSGAHDFLIERGIVPDYHIEVDPREHKAWFTRNPHPDVTYWPASCCHPVLIDNLVEKRSKVALWHVYNSDTDRKIVDSTGPDPGGWLICGGGSVACRAVNVMYTQGFRSFSIYGMDCSFEPTGEQHAGEHSGKKHHPWNIRVGDRWFLTSANLVYTARGFIQNAKVLRQSSEANNEPFIEGTNMRVDFMFHGRGLLQEMVGAISQEAA
jgi:hypothetical protein